MQNILIATHTEDGKDKIINKGMEMAEILSARIILLTVIDNTTNFMMPELVMEATSHWQEDLKTVKNEQDKIKKQFGKIQVETMAILGNPGVEIIVTATDKNVSLIVMGTHGRTGISHVLMGSTAEFVVRNSLIPVLVVPLSNR